MGGIVSGALAFLGGGGGGGAGGTSSSGQTQANTFIDPRTAGFDLQLRQNANRLVPQSQKLILDQIMSGLGTNLSGAGNDILGGLTQAGAASGGGIGAALGGLGAFAAQGPQALLGQGMITQAGQGAQQLLGQNPALQGQIDSLSAFLQQNLAATAGTIGGQATLAGGTGGSRQALATGLAAQESERQFGAGASALLSQDFASRQALAPQLLNTQLQAGQALQGGNLTQLQQQLDSLGSLGTTGGIAAGAGASALEQLQPLFDLGLAPSMAGFLPLLLGRQVQGTPEVLSSSQSQQESGGFDFGILG